MKKKGFTLIELLAVIVILAVIALIATPMILGVIESAKKGAFESSSYGIVESAEQGYMQAQMSTDSPILTKYQYEDGTEIKKQGNIDLKYKGGKPTDGTVTINESGKVSLVVYNGIYCATKEYNDEKIKLEKISKEECIMKSFTPLLKSFGGSGAQEFVDVAAVKDGYVVVGYSTSSDGDLANLNKGTVDAFIIKYDLPGTIVWKKNFGGSGYDFFYRLISLEDGYLAVGSSASTDGDLTGLNKGGEDAVIVKYDLNGNIIWKKAFGGSGEEKYTNAILVDDGYIVVGYSRSVDGDLTGLSKGGKDAILVKYNFDGKIQWKKNFGGSGWDIFSGISVMNDGYIVAGDSSSTDGDLSGLDINNGDGILVKYDLDGNILWKKKFGGDAGDDFMSVTSVSDGYIVVGYGSSSDGDMDGLKKGEIDAIIVKYDFDGNVLWKKSYGGEESTYFGRIISDVDGYLTVGRSNSKEGDLAGLNKGEYDAIIVKYDFSGNVLWKKNFGGSESDSFYGVALTKDGYIAVGSSESNDGNLLNLKKGLLDAILIKYDRYGNN